MVLLVLFDVSCHQSTTSILVLIICVKYERGLEALFYYYIWSDRVQPCVGSHLSSGVTSAFGAEWLYAICVVLIESVVF
jgi:hypothetical protein